MQIRSLSKASAKCNPLKRCLPFGASVAELTYFGRLNHLLDICLEVFFHDVSFTATGFVMLTPGDALTDAHACEAFRFGNSYSKRTSTNFDGQVLAGRWLFGKKVIRLVACQLVC
jgi:hypothetical protein